MVNYVTRDGTVRPVTGWRLVRPDGSVQTLSELRYGEALVWVLVVANAYIAWWDNSHAWHNDSPW